MKIRIPHDAIHASPFMLLAFLCYQAHQLVRHLVGAALCGGFGSMTFSVATTRQPCAFETLVILSGPILTYGLAWFGMFLLRSPKYGLFAYALIFASFAHLRWIQTLTGRGDELLLVHRWTSAPSRLLVAAIVVLISLPPVAAAFRSIANRGRTAIFVSSYLLPLPMLALLLVGDQLLFGAGGFRPQGATILGISLLVFLTDLAASTGFILTAPRYLKVESSQE